MNGKASLVTLDYVMDVGDAKRCETDSEIAKKGRLEGQTRSNFRLSYYPHRVARFGEILMEGFGAGAKHQVYGDFKPIGEIEDPAFYIHIISKKS